VFGHKECQQLLLNKGLFRQSIYLLVGEAAEQEMEDV